MMKKTRKRFWIFWIGMFVAAFLILWNVGYSDGDDAYFYQYTNSMGFLEYLGWRYETWVGRMGAEALVYIAFRLGLPFWRTVNALMLVLLPLGVIYLATRAARVPDGTLAEWKCRQPVCAGKNFDELGLGIAVTAVAGYFMMNAHTLGYAAVWMNGSIFYTWSFACGIWALTTFSDFVFSDKPAADGPFGRLHMSMEDCAAWKFLYAIPCAVIASMSIEQMGAVLLVFELLGVIYGILKWHRVHPLLLVQTLVTASAFAILFLAPGNDVRVAAEIVSWMPQYETMSFGEHLFITLHWLISSFANENKLFLCAIWAVGCVLLFQKKKQSMFDHVLFFAAVVFILVALLPYVGITAFSNIGMDYLNIEQCIYEVPTMDKLTGMQAVAMIWWSAALVYTFVFLWRVSGCQITLLLSYLAGIASEEIMFFSPTMYASGGRVYYLTDILYLFILFALAFGVSEPRRRNGIFGFCVALGMINFISQIPVFVGMILWQ